MRLISSLLLCILILGGCKKEDAASPDDFSVVLEPVTYHAGDTVLFRLSGDPGMLVFYSGEAGKRYEHRNRLSGAGKVKLVFQTTMQQGPVPPKPTPDSLHLLISTNLLGYDAENILKAAWTNITSRNTKWPANLSTAYTTSDSIDISDFNTAEKINIAFRVLNKKSGVTSQRKWAMQNLTISNQMPDGSNTLVMANFAAAGWVHASLKNDSYPGTPENGYNGYNAWNVGTWGISSKDSVRNSNGLPIRSAYPVTFSPGPDVNNEDNDDWLISSPIDLKTVKPDAGTVIKTAVQVKMEEFGYIFRHPGTYEVAFVAVNASLHNSREAVRRVTVTILP